MLKEGEDEEDEEKEDEELLSMSEALRLFTLGNELILKGVL